MENTDLKAINKAIFDIALAISKLQGTKSQGTKSQDEDYSYQNITNRIAQQIATQALSIRKLITDIK